MDILASKTTYATHVEDLERVENLFSKFRKTASARYCSESISHGFIRSYMDLDHSTRLIDILKDKLKYGIFLDDYSGNMLMDNLIKSENFEGAMRIASEFMLQEECENAIARSFSVYSCLVYLNSVSLNDLFKSSIPEESNVKEEVEYVKVPYIPNEVYDDHFDINDSRKLLGKTMCFFGFQDNTSIDHSLKLIGSALHGKFENSLSLLRDSKNTFPQFVLDIVLGCVENYNEEEESKLNYYPLPLCKEKPRPVLEIISDLKDQISNTKNLDKTQQMVDFVELARNNLLKDLKIHEKTDIHNQIFLIDKWRKERNEKYKDQVKRFHLEERKKALLAEIDELERQEEILTFFDNQSKIVMHYAADGKFTDEDPLSAKVEDEEKFNRDYRRFYKLHRYDPIVYYKHRNEERYEPPMFRVGVVDKDTLEQCVISEKLPQRRVK